MPKVKFRLNNYVTVQELAKRLSVNVITVYRWIKSGWVNAEKRGKIYFISESEANKIAKQVK